MLHFLKSCRRKKLKVSCGLLINKFAVDLGSLFGCLLVVGVLNITFGWDVS